MTNPLFVTVKHPEKPAVKIEIVAYYNKLQHGQGHTTRAKVYGNFSINMKRMLNNILCQLVPNFAILYNSRTVGTVIDNLDEREVNRIVKIQENIIWLWIKLHLIFPMVIAKSRILLIRFMQSISSPKF